MKKPIQIVTVGYLLLLICNIWVVKPWPGEPKILTFALLAILLTLNPLLLGVLGWHTGRWNLKRFGIPGLVLFLLLLEFGSPVIAGAQWGLDTTIQLITRNYTTNLKNHIFNWLLISFPYLCIWLASFYFGGKKASTNPG